MIASLDDSMIAARRARVSSALRRSVMSRMKPWTQSGVPSSSRTRIVSSSTHTVRPSAVT